jgi:hypothetical protein
MKNTENPENATPQDEDMLDEYRFDYRKARPNRFADRLGRDMLMVVLDPDVAAVFRKAEAVNNVLRALIATMPKVEKTEEQ